MATRYYIRLPDPRKARGDDAELAFKSDGAQGFAAELLNALHTSALFDRWKHLQAEPDDVDTSLAATDEKASVKGAQHDLHIDLEVVTSISGNVLKHRMKLLAGSHWQLIDVTAA
jgi:hypothetical protein